MGTGSRPGDPQAVYYAAEDYAGLWRHIIADLVDGVATLVLLVVAIMIAGIGAVVVGRYHGAWLFLLLCVASVYWYLVVLKRSRFKTLGYRLARIRVVDILGRTPGLGTMSVRLLCAVLGPIDPLIDLIWIPSDRFKQSLRDKIAHTYVVKSTAEPRGPARITYRQYYLLGMSFVFQEIEPLDAPRGVSPSTGGVR